MCINIDIYIYIYTHVYARRSGDSSGSDPTSARMRGWRNSYQKCASIQHPYLDAYHVNNNHHHHHNDNINIIIIKNCIIIIIIIIINNKDLGLLACCSRLCPLHPLLMVGSEVHK